MSREFSILMGAVFAVACSTQVGATPAPETAPQIAPQTAPQAAALLRAPLAPESHAVPQSEAAPRRDGLTCDIAVKRTANGVRVTPVVRSDRSVSGEYALVITKIGAGGSSDIRQGGPFDIAGGGREELGVSEFTLERNARFRATLKVRANGREICRDHVS